MNTKVLLVFYHPGKHLSDKAEEIINKHLPSDIEVQYIDIDAVSECLDITKEYGIHMTPTIILLDDGEEINREYGNLTPKLFLKFINC